MKHNYVVFYNGKNWCLYKIKNLSSFSYSQTVIYFFWLSQFQGINSCYTAIYIALK